MRGSKATSHLPSSSGSTSHEVRECQSVFLGRRVWSMPDITREFLRKLSEWSADGAPVSSFYLDVDGRRYPRKQDYEVRADELCHRLREQGGTFDSREARRSVERDVARFLNFVRDLDRGRTRGIALFSSSSADLWEEVLVPRSLPDRVTLSRHPYVLPLEALLETYETFCTCLVDREKARVFLAKMSQIEEETGVLDEVPGQHDQGGWSQARYQRHIEDHVARHFKHVGDVLLSFHKRRGFDHLILAGTDEVIAGFEPELHDYPKKKIVARINLPMTATPRQVLERSVQVEERVEVERERRLVERLKAEAAAGRQSVLGLSGVLGALNEGRVETLVIPIGLSAEGMRCTNCGRLSLGGRTCHACGGRLQSEPDIVDLAVAAALQQGARVETLTMLNSGPGGHHDIGALLRF
jgi:peptide chain release factor subunit 1